MRVRTWPLLAAAFGALLTVLLFASLFSFSKSTELETKVFKVHQDSISGARALAGIRSDVYASTLLVQQALLAPTAGSTKEARQQLIRLRDSQRRRVEALARLLRPNQSARLASLRIRLQEHWRFLDSALGNTPSSARTRERNGAISDIINLTKEMEQLNAENLSGEEAELHANWRAFREFVAQLIIGTLLLFIAITLFTIMRVINLEKIAEKRREQTERAEAELRRLSNQLVKSQEEERKNISRELHDEVGQLLTGLRIELRNLEGESQDADAFHARLQDVKGIAEQALRTVRNMAMLLRPSMLDDLGLGPALRWQAKEFSRRSDIPVEVELDEQLDGLPSEYSVCLYRVVQEALTNCARYANASKVSIQVRQIQDRVMVAIEDNGKGFDARRRSSGLGLLGIEERVRELKGRVTIHSEANKGTKIEAELPVPQLKTI